MIIYHEYFREKNHPQFAKIANGQIQISRILHQTNSVEVKHHEPLLQIKPLSLNVDTIDIADRRADRVWYGHKYSIATTSSRITVSYLQTLESNWSNVFERSQDYEWIRQIWFDLNEIPGDVFLTRMKELIWLSKHDQSFFVKMADEK